ncbi:MAG: uridine kinase [Pseudomonadota bacterium]
MPHAKPLIIAISGPSGTGKSTFATALAQALSEQSPARVALIHEDAYYRDQSHLTMAQRQQTDYDHPAALEHSLLLTHLHALGQGNAVAVPVYDYTQHTRSERTLQQQPAEVLILEGILLFSNQELMQLANLRLFINTPLTHCKQRRIDRDTQERGRTRDAVEAQFEQCVVPMYRQYLDIWQQQADLVIDGEAPTAVAVALALAKLRSQVPVSTGILPD